MKKVFAMMNLVNVTAIRDQVLGEETGGGSIVRKTIQARNSL
ncbi:hypothetical protein [Nitrosopumilus sp.]|nr:hypothetical protein [Nitrosopumilus sp.]